MLQVFKEGGKFKAAWYSAKILNLNSGKAFVSYTELQADDGNLIYIYNVVGIFYKLFRADYQYWQFVQLIKFQMTEKNVYNVHDFLY